MKVEFDTQEIEERITQAVVCALKPLLAKGKVEDDTVFDVKALAKYLSVSAKWIYERTQLKEIPYYKIGGQLRFRKSDIDKWLALYKVPAISPPPRKMHVIK